MPFDPSAAAPAAESAPAPGLRERRRQETSAQIHAAAVACVEKEGLDGATVADIAAAAGVSSRTFFRYFPSKEAAILPGQGELARRLDELAHAPAPALGAPATAAADDPATGATAGGPATGAAAEDPAQRAAAPRPGAAAPDTEADRASQRAAVGRLVDLLDGLIRDDPIDAQEHRRIGALLEREPALRAHVSSEDAELIRRSVDVLTRWAPSFDLDEARLHAELAFSAWRSAWWSWDRLGPTPGYPTPHSRWLWAISRCVPAAAAVAGDRPVSG